MEMEIVITTSDNLRHHISIVNGEPDIDGYSAYQPTRDALSAAYADGDWVSYTPPESVQIPEPDWDGFNLAILANAEFNTAYGVAITAYPLVAAALPAALTQVAVGSITMFVTAFEALCQAASVSSEQRNIWATVAESYDLPTEFVAAIRGEDGG